MSYLFQSPVRENLLSLLLKFLKKNFNKENLNFLLQRNLTDKRYFEIFNKRIEDNNKNDKNKIDINTINLNRGKNRLNDLNEFINDGILINDSNLESYLDIGCSDGIITSTIGQGLGFKLSNIYATDIIVSKNKLDPLITFKLCDGHKLDFSDKQFNLITLFQVMHHMVNIDEMLAELARVCKFNAIIIIREHDLEETKFHTLNNNLYKIEHELYEILFDHVPYEEFINNYYAKYDTMDGWTKKLKKYGFNLINTRKISKFNPTNYYYAIYQYTGIIN